MQRAQSHSVDFGFAKIPTMTREDVIIAKAFALAIEPNRFQDLDDLKSMFSTNRKMDLAYLKGELQRHTLQIPRSIADIAPKSLPRARR